MFYSATTNGFYSNEIHGQEIPEDAVEITKEQYIALIDGQASGKRITSDEDGQPVLAVPDTVITIPTKITMRQCRLQLLADDVLDQVETAIAEMDQAARIEWECGTVVDRANPLIPALMTVLDWDDDRADQFYTDAAER